MKTRGVIAALSSAFLVFAACAAGPFGSDQSGIPMSSSVFHSWISGVVNYQHPDNSGGFANDDSGSPTDPATAVIGKPAIATNNDMHVLSLGNGGSIIVAFDETICDGPGADFAVFENGFTDGTVRSGDTNRYTFVELAFVEVATTTNAWARFPSQFLGTNVIYNFDYTPKKYWASQDATLIDGLAGKHVVQLGTPFDLSALRTNPNVLSGAVDLNCIRYIRLVDIVGDGSTFDSSNRPIYDPYFNYATGWPNPAPNATTDGFDLRAVGVINSGGLSMRSGKTLAWFAVTNNLWQVQVANAPDGVWTNLGAQVIGNDTTRSVTDPDAGTSRFYRLQRQRAP